MILLGEREVGEVLIRVVYERVPGQAGCPAIEQQFALAWLPACWIEQHAVPGAVGWLLVRKLGTIAQRPEEVHSSKATCGAGEVVVCRCELREMFGGAQG